MQKDSFFKFYFLFIFWLGVAALVPWSFQEKLAARTPAAIEAIVADEYVWDKQSVSVCWDKTENFLKVSEAVVAYNASYAEKSQLLSADDRKLVEQKVREQFSIHNVGLEFVGWNECQNDDKSDIKIFAFDSIDGGENYPPGEANIGQSCEIWQPQKLEFKIEKREPLKPGYLFINKTPLKDKKYYSDANVSLVRVALHEFGHAAGLVHEHYQAEAKSDPNCKVLQKENPNFNKLEVDLGRLSVYSKYDEKSMMNWCFTTSEDLRKDAQLADVQLSQQDQQALKCVYKKYTGVDYRRKCKASNYKYERIKKKPVYKKGIKDNDDDYN